MAIFDLKKNLVFVRTLPTHQHPASKADTTQYGAYHRDPTNVAIHIACVPMLLATGFVLVTLPPFPTTTLAYHI
jgi:hypothetical protein